MSFPENGFPSLQKGLPLPEDPARLTVTVETEFCLIITTTEVVVCTGPRRANYRLHP